MQSEFRNLLTCGDCGIDLNFPSCHYILKGVILCSVCRSQYDENGFSEARGQLKEVTK